MEDQMRMVSFPKKMWKVVRFFFFMLRKGICNRKLLLDLSLLLKRGKIAGKAALNNLMFLHHHHNHPFSFFTSAPSAPPGEYEFSCSNTPAHPTTFHLLTAALHATNGRRSGGRAKKVKQQQARYQAQYESIEEEFAAVDNGAFVQMVMMCGDQQPGGPASPVLPGLGFGRSPAVRQLRVTDSPFPILNGKEDGDCRVDEAADDFIKRFYSQLRRQSLTDA